MLGLRQVDTPFDQIIEDEPEDDPLTVGLVSRRVPQRSEIARPNEA